MDYFFRDKKQILKSEPIDIINYIDNMEYEKKMKIFPNLNEYYNSNPKNLLDLILKCIEQDVVINVKKTDDVIEKKHHNSDEWNELSLLYKKNKEINKTFIIYDRLIECGAFDLETLHNYGTCLIEYMLDKKKLTLEEMNKAKDLINNAFILEMGTKSRKDSQFLECCLLESYHNLVLIRYLESKILYEKEQHDHSFLFSWICIEMNLMKKWIEYLSKKNISKSIMEELYKWDIKQIIDNLYLIGLLEKQTYYDINKIRKTRNNIFHGAQIKPVPEETKLALKLGIELLQ